MGKSSALLVYCDPDLSTRAGHNLHYAQAVLTAAANDGVSTLAVVNVAAPDVLVSTQVHRAYTHSSWDQLSIRGYRSRANTAALEARFVAETAPVLRFLRGWATVVVLIPNGFLHHLGACEQLARRFDNCRFDILFRYERAFFDTPYSRRLFARAERANLGDRLTLSTDSHRLQCEIGGLTRLPVRLHPIPHVAPENVHSSPPELSQVIARPMEICHLGNARVEKGFHHVVRAMANAQVLPFATRFHVQTSDPDAQSLPILGVFDWPNNPTCVLYRESLSEREYFTILASSDVTLLPYDPTIYFSRTSGLALDSMLVGTPVIVPNHTWMADIVKRYKNGVIIDQLDQSTIHRAIVEARDRLPELRRAAGVARLELAVIHNPARFVASVMGEPLPPADPRRGKRAAIIFPWGDLLKRQSGAAYRFAEMLTFLEAHYDQVRVLYLGGESGAFTSRSFCESYNNRHWYVNPLRFALIIVCYLARVPYQDIVHLWLFWMARRDDALSLRCEELARWGDDIFVEYPYLSPLLEEPCRRTGSRLFTTVHDILSAQVCTTFIRRLTQRVEIDAIRRGGTIIALNADEGRALGALGIVAHHAATPFVQPSASKVPTFDDAQRLLARQHRLAIHHRRVVLFIGSEYGPNIEAARYMRQAARDYQRQHGPTPLFVVAGGCHSPCINDGFASLGSVSAEVIEALYSVATVVLVPLLAGTGVSIKAIEALSRGKAVVATSVGVRGLPVTSGTHCVIHDDRNSMKTVVEAVIASNEVRAHLEQNAQAFARRHGYEIFQTTLLNIII